MKLATRISSIRRQAWKQCRSCSADSLSMWLDSLDRNALAGWIRSPFASSTAVTGCWASQSISRSGCSLRSSSAMATSRCAWPNPIGEEMNSARLGRDLPRTHRCRRRRRWMDRLDELPQEQVHLHRIAGVGEVTGAFEVDEGAVGALGQLDRPRLRRDGVLVAGDHQHRAVHALAQVDERLADLLGGAHQPHPEGRVDQRLGRGLQPPADAVLDLLGGVRLAARLREEELEEALVVAPPVVLVVLVPALVGVELVLEGVERSFHVGWSEGRGRPDEGGARHPLGVEGRQDERPVGAEGQGDQDGLVHTDRVHDRHRVLGELQRRVRRARPSGESERPLPRPSKVTTRKWRLR